MIDVRVEILSDVNLLPYPPLLLSRPPSLVSGCEGSLHVARLPEATLHSHQQATRCRALLEVNPVIICQLTSWLSFSYLAYLSHHVQYQDGSYRNITM